MAELIKHICIKCKASYEDNEVDDYYCKSCIEEKERIAKEIDSKIKTDKPRIKTEFEMYQDITRQTGKPFVNARDLGFF